MIKVEKINDENYPDIKISKGINSFVIARKNLPDPCWYPEINYFLNNDDITFIIKEEDGDIYILFEKLYQDVIDGNVFPLSEKDFKGKSDNEIENLKRENEEEKTHYKKIAQRSGLVNNGVINLHSEDYDPYESASILTIKKLVKKIEITFSKNKKDVDGDFAMNPHTYNVRITESGVIYWPFYTLFVNFHRQLQSLEWDKIDEQAQKESANLLGGK